MMALLVFRERVKNTYQRYDIYITPMIKFLFAFIIFTTMNRRIGYDTRLSALPIVLGISLLSAFAPSAIMVLIASIISILHIYAVSPILSIMILLFIMIIYFLFARFTPKLGMVIVAVPILYVLKIPYVIPLLLGIVATPLSIIPTVCGVLIYFIFQVVKSAVSMQVNMTVDDILQLYIYVIDNLRNNRLMIMSCLIFSLMILVTYFVRRMKFDYAHEISIAAGGAIGVLGFLISDIMLDKTNQIFLMIIGIIVSAGIVYLVQFFQLSLDYSGVEHVQFEDDSYYYYVKAIPKITVTAPQKNVKHINVKSGDKMNVQYDDDDSEYDDGYEEELYVENVNYDYGDDTTEQKD